jgi:hypothetical protein
LSGWIKALARALEKKLGSDSETLLQSSEIQTHEAATTAIAAKLDGMAKVLDLHSYNKHGHFLGKLNSVSLTEIQPALIICPKAMECVTKSCKYRALLMASREWDTSHATVIMGSAIYRKVPVLGGQCPVCHTKYYADQEVALQPGGQNSQSKLYLNDAKYLKVGKGTWVDRGFSSTVLNAMYSFHASAATYTEFWNDTFHKAPHRLQVTCRIIWQTFIQESIQQVAEKADISLVLDRNLGINKVTQNAYKVLGESGKIRSADRHSCAECTHAYKKTPDIITEDDPAAVVNINENRAVPALVGEGADLAV